VSTVPSTEAQNQFGRIIDDAQRAPVTITRKGRPIAVIVSAVDYARLEEAAEALLAIRAREAEQEGMMGQAASAALLKRLGDAKA
jgi:antitoxin Phd